MFLLYSSYKNRIDTYYNVIAKDEYGNIVSEVETFNMQKCNDIFDNFLKLHDIEVANLR